jgi:peptidoglycan/xylan/chitin deacetylase (PgdA/CDA1 family)
MRGLSFLCSFVGLSLLSALSVFAQGRSVAITVDDLPYAGGALTAANASDASSSAELVNPKLLAAFHAHHVPVTGFVNQKYAEALGKSGRDIFKEWIRRELDLGNHMYSHSDINNFPWSRLSRRS